MSTDQVSFYSGANGQSSGHALSNFRVCNAVKYLFPDLATRADLFYLQQAMESHTSFVSTDFAVGKFHLIPPFICAVLTKLLDGSLDAALARVGAKVVKTAKLVDVKVSTTSFT